VAVQQQLLDLMAVVAVVVQVLLGELEVQV
jgi:hypothetical protein